MNSDTMLTFLDAYLLAAEGKDPTQAIVNQEKRGQQNVVRSKRLPKKVNSNTVPHDIYMAGVTNGMSYEERKKVTDLNLMAYTINQYTEMGIKVLGDYDDLFFEVELPEGWDTRATSHTMWNELIDEKGRKRGTFFYKAAFYDRDAFINFETRFQLEVTHDCDPEEDYSVWKKADLVGIVKDAGTTVYKTAPVPAEEDYDKERRIRDRLYDEVESYLKKEHPDYNNIHAYWND